MHPPNHVGRTCDEIIREKSHLDSVGYIFRSVSWLDYFRRVDHFPTLLYACIEGRYGIEYLLFEELVIGTGANLSRHEYEKCLKEPTKLSNAIDRLVPDYIKLQEFTSAVVALEPSSPRLVFWQPKALMKSWGNLSKYLHWRGARSETTENPSWRRKAFTDVEQNLMPVWKKITSGQSGLIQSNTMKPEIYEVWQDFKSGRINIESAKIRMKILRPRLIEKYGWIEEQRTVLRPPCG